MANISKLIGDTFCLSYHLVYISMGMTTYPIVNMTISYKVFKFCRKDTIYRTAHEVWGYQFK